MQHVAHICSLYLLLLIKTLLLHSKYIYLKTQVGTVADVILMPVSPFKLLSSLFFRSSNCLSVCLLMLLTYLPLPAYQAAYVFYVPATESGKSGEGIETESETESESESVLPSWMLTRAALCNEQQQCNLIQHSPPSSPPHMSKQTRAFNRNCKF